MHTAAFWNGGKIVKQILASILLLGVLWMPTSTSDSAPPAPEEVTTLIDADSVTVTWTPPPLLPEDLLVATYEIHGIDEAGNKFYLKSIPAKTFSGEVATGYANYGVRVVLGEDVSIVQRACIGIVLTVPPTWHNHCDVPP